MRIIHVTIWVAVAGVVAALITFAIYGETSAKEKWCLACHSPDIASKLGPPPVDKSVLEASVHRELMCISCHPGAQELPHPALRPAAPEACSRCHSRVFQEYKRSIHGQRFLLRGGTPLFINCTDCHGDHNIKSHTDPASLVYPDNIPGTCGKCHQKATKEYQSGIHWQLRMQRVPNTPVCTNCHQSHSIVATEMGAFLLASPEACGECHKEHLKAYYKTYHGQMVRKGYLDVARCSDCHGAHNIPAAVYSKEEIIKTCRAPGCHPEATVNVVELSPHAVGETRPLLRLDQIDHMGWFFPLLGLLLLIHILGTVIWRRLRR